MHLWLLRHAHAQTSASSGRDEDRRLSTDGRAACHGLQSWIRNHREGLPGTVLVSPARRTLETAQTALDRLPLPAIDVERALWNASAGDLVALLERCSERPQPLMLIGHNPGLEDLVRWLCGSVPLPGMKPGTLAIIELDPPLRPGCGRLAQFVHPSDSM